MTPPKINHVLRLSHSTAKSYIVGEAVLVKTVDVCKCGSIGKSPSFFVFFLQSFSCSFIYDRLSAFNNNQQQQQQPRQQHHRKYYKKFKKSSTQTSNAVLTDTWISAHFSNLPGLRQKRKWISIALLFGFCRCGHEVRGCEKSEKWPPTDTRTAFKLLGWLIKHKKVAFTPRLSLSYLTVERTLYLIRLGHVPLSMWVTSKAWRWTTWRLKNAIAFFEA